MASRRLNNRFVVAVLCSGLFVFASPSGPALAQVLVGKRCEHCGQPVPITSQVGDTCPHCGVTWGAAQVHIINGGQNMANVGPQNNGPGNVVPNSGYPEQPPQYSPAPAPSFNFHLDESATRWLVRYQHCQELRQQEAARRELNYQRLREKTEEFRAKDDPEQRAERYLAAAVGSEARGETRAAVAYYRLVLRSAATSPAARQATEALERLQAD